MVVVLTILCVATLLFILGGVYFVKLFGQAQQDKERQHYQVTFPPELTSQEVAEWLTSISGALRGGWWGLVGNPSIAFEVRATHEGLTHTMRVPWRQAEFIIGQLHAKIPGVYAERVKPEEHPYWLKLHEYGESHPEHTLNIPDPSALAVRLLTAMGELREKEEVLLQVIVMAPPMSSKPEEALNRDILEDSRRQLDEMNLGAVVRIAATGMDNGSAAFRLKKLHLALDSTRTSMNRLHKRKVMRFDLESRVNNGSGALTTTSMIKVSELSGLIGWASDPSIPGMPKGKPRKIAAPTNVSSEGIKLGINNPAGRERAVAVRQEDLMMHTWIGGRTGVGKSALMANMAKQMMAAGSGLVLMETEGNLYDNVLNYVPADRVNDVILMDFSDPVNIVGFNVLDQGNPDVVIDELIELFEHQYGGGVWSDEYIYNGLKTLGDAEEKMSIVDLLPLINPRTPAESEWADNLIRQVKDVELKRWWQRHDNRGKDQQQQRADPVLSRMNQFVARPELRYVFGQRESTFKMADVLRDGKILLINLKGVSSKTTGLVGTMLMNAYWHAIKTTDKTKPSYLLLDEFADYMDLAVPFETMLAQARKRGVGLVLANQHLSQLSAPVRDGVLANARNKIVFQSRADDAKVVMREMASHLDPREVTGLQQYEALADVVTPTGTSGAFSLRTYRPAKPTGAAGGVIRSSRETYTRPMTEVQTEILHRYDQAATPRQKPKISGA